MIRYAWMEVSLLVAVLAGCGTKEYESRVDKARQRLTQDSAFSQMHPSRDLAGVPISVQVGPKDFADTPLDEATEPRRLKPPLPTTSLFTTQLKATYEGSITDSEGGKIPFYCHFAVIDNEGLGTRDPKAWIRSDLTSLPAQPSEWKPVQCAGADGRTTEWQVIEATAEQEMYYVDKADKGGFSKMPTRMQVYLNREANYTVLIGWRVPTSIEPNVNLNDWGPRVAASVKVR